MHINKKHSLRLASEDDKEFVYQTIKSGDFQYIDEIWGWDEAKQRSLFDTEFNTENVYVIMFDEKSVGFCQIIRTNRIYICELHLSSKFRGLGIGSSVLAEIITEGKSAGLPVYIGCFKNIIRARRLYEKIGFSLIGETETHYELKL
ncbi:MAG: hypothetical protein A2Y17_04680 [Clostridiales bacterium GWF2_38_85]|nr:MAG: hypothetical protein A2Y17_04680 [Clostridiales bacterium GWF2_38_85]